MYKCINFYTTIRNMVSLTILNFDIIIPLFPKLISKHSIFKLIYLNSRQYTRWHSVRKVRASDPGIVYYNRNVLNMRNVKGKVKNSYRPHKMLYYTVLDGIIMALFYNHIGLNDFESNIPVPEHFQNYTEEQKLHCIGWMTLWKNCTEVFFDNGTDICQSLREVLSDPNHPENYWTENICEVGLGLSVTFEKRIMLL